MVAVTPALGLDAATPAIGLGAVAAGAVAADGGGNAHTQVQRLIIA